MLKLLIVVLVSLGLAQAAKLSVSGRDLMYNGQKVYLNGVNAAWNNYGYDFGNGGYDGSLEGWMADVSSAGGNSFRIWVHVEGYSTPAFDGNGFVTACDNTGQFINDIKTFLDAAQSSDILVIFTLFNGAAMSNQPLINMINDDSKLQSYLDNCLAPLVQAVAGHPALGAYEAINEPEGSVFIESNSNPCYDTTLIGQSGAGWTGTGIKMERFLSFIGKINTVVKANDPTSLVTLGSWGQFPQSDAFPNTKNHYTDACLNGASGSSTAGLDFYQMHTYDWGGYWSDNAPFTVSADDYELDKPNVLGEFASVCALNTPLTDLHEYGYTHGYSGTMTWHWTATGGCSDTQDAQRQALSQLDGRSENGVVDISVS